MHYVDSTMQKENEEEDLYPRHEVKRPKTERSSTFDDINNQEEDEASPLPQRCKVCKRTGILRRRLGGIPLPKVGGVETSRSNWKYSNETGTCDDCMGRIAGICFGFEHHRCGVCFNSHPQSYYSPDQWRLGNRIGSCVICQESQKQSLRDDDEDITDSDDDCNDNDNAFSEYWERDRVVMMELQKNGVECYGFDTTHSFFRFQALRLPSVTELIGTYDVMYACCSTKRITSDLGIGNVIQKRTVNGCLELYVDNNSESQGDSEESSEEGSEASSDVDNENENEYKRMKAKLCLDGVLLSLLRGEPLRCAYGIETRRKETLITSTRKIFEENFISLTDIRYEARIALYLI